MSLESGVRAGSVFLGTMESIKRSKQSRETHDEEQAEIRRRRKEALEIQKAGQAAVEEAAEAMQPVPVQAMPPAAAAAQQAAPAAEPAAMEPVATATPVAPPGSGAAPSGESLTMEPVTQGAPAPTAPPAYEEPRHHAPPAGSTISPEEVPSMASLRTASGQPVAPSPMGPVGPVPQPTEQGGAPAAPPGTMPQTRTPDELDRINQVLMAQTRKAAELGRTDLALQYHVQGMKLREQLRGKALDAAETQFRTTGDVNAFVPVFNRFISNGTTVDSLAKQPDGSYALAGHTDDGKKFQQKLSAAQMGQYLEHMRNPQVARAMEAKRAEEIRKGAQEIRVEQVKAGAKDRFLTVPAGGTVVDTAQGTSFTAPKDSTNSFELKTVKDADGAETLVRHNKDTGAVVPLFGTRTDGSRLPEAVTKMQKDAVAAVFKAAGADSDVFSMMEGDQKAKLTTQIETAADLVAANYGTDNWKGMSHAKAASIAQAIEDGRARIVQIKLPNQDQPVRGVVYDGRKYLLDPNASPGGGGGGGKASPETQRAFNSNPTVASSQAKAGSRESDRTKILNDELEVAQTRLQSAKTDAERKRAQSDIEALSRELGIMPPAPPRTVAPASPSVEQQPTPSQQTGIGTRKVEGRIS